MHGASIHVVTPSAGKGSIAYLHPASHHSARAKTRWCCCSYSRGRLAPTEASSPTVKANRGAFSSSFRLGRQLQTDIIICKCKSRSYPRLFPLRASTELSIEHIGNLRAGALCDTVFVAFSLLSGKEWLQVE